jgi:hypothetical protein
MSRSMPVRLLLGAAAVIFAAACGEHASPTSPNLAVAPPPPKPPKGHQVASCQIPKDINASAVIGPKGGKLDLGQHNTLVVFPGALVQNTLITAHVPAGTQEKVQFGPEGLQFRVPAVLTLNYSPCVTPFFDVTVAYLRADTVVEVVPSVNNPVNKTVDGFISHFSSYAVAY